MPRELHGLHGEVPVEWDIMREFRLAYFHIVIACSTGEASGSTFRQSHIDSAKKPLRKAMRRAECTEVSAIGTVQLRGCVAVVAKSSIRDLGPIRSPSIARIGNFRRTMCPGELRHKSLDGAADTSYQVLLAVKPSNWGPERGAQYA